MSSILRARATSGSVQYPRRGPLRLLRAFCLIGWWLIALYAGGVALNVITILLRQRAFALADRAQVVQALFLPDTFAEPNTPLLAFAPFVLLFGLLALSGAWALRDLARERRTQVLRQQVKVAERVEQKEHDWQLEEPALFITSIDGTGTPRHEPLIGNTVTVGRDTSNSIVLHDTRVSRRQLQLTRETAYWRVTCLPKTATLYLNGLAQTTALLRPRDQLVVGATIMRFEAPLPPTTTVLEEQTPKLVISYANVSFTAALRDARITLGRAQDCGIVVPSRIMSRYHAELLRTSDAEYEIADLGAGNPLQFEGQPVSRHSFRHGDTITIGSGSGVEVILLRYLAPDSWATTSLDVNIEPLGPGFP